MNDNVESTEPTAEPIDDVTFLARAMHRKDVQEFGTKTDEGWFPTWDMIGDQGQEEYMRDARFVTSVLTDLRGWKPGGDSDE